MGESCNSSRMTGWGPCQILLLELCIYNTGKRIIELAHWLGIVRGQNLNKIRYPGVNRAYKPASTLSAFAKLGSPESWIHPTSPYLCPHFKLIFQMVTLSSKCKLKINHPSHHQPPHQGTVRKIAHLKLWSWEGKRNKEKKKLFLKFITTHQPLWRFAVQNQTTQIVQKNIWPRI